MQGFRGGGDYKFIFLLRAQKYINSNVENIAVFQPLTGEQI